MNHLSGFGSQLIEWGRDALVAVSQAVGLKRNATGASRPQGLLILLALVAAAPLPAAVPQIGERPPDFTLRTLDDKAVRLHALTAKAPVVLVVLRGWPGYQCPICNRQVHELLSKFADFAQAGAQLVLVYPGPDKDLRAHAAEFLKDKPLPANFHFVTDPDYTMTKAYGLRWDAPKETAYPSTFVLGPRGQVKYAVVSKTHGGRASTMTVLAELKK